MNNKRYTNRILLFSFLMCISFYTPVFASFFQVSNCLSANQITGLFACGSLAVFLFEVPTGLLGDTIGEKKSLILGSGLTAISTLIFIYGDTLLLYVGEIIFGIGSTFFSGPFDALLFKYCKTVGEKDYYSKTVSKCYSVQWLALCVSFLGSSVFSYFGNLAIPFYATLFANSLTLGAGFYLPDTQTDNAKKPIGILKSALESIIHNRNLRYACLLSASFTMLLISGYQLLQPYLSASGIDASYNGLIYCIAALFASCGSYCFDRIQKTAVSKHHILTACILIIAVCYLGLAKVSDFLLIFIFVCCYRLVWGITAPMFSHMVNISIVNDEFRDTVFSIISLFSNLLGSVFLFTLGLINMTVSANYFILTSIAFLISLVLSLLKSVQ